MKATPERSAADPSGGTPEPADAALNRPAPDKPAAVLTSAGMILLFMAAHFAHHLVNALPVPLLPMIREDFGLDYTRAGFLVAAFTIPYGISQFPAGWLADRWHPRIVLSLGISGVAVAGLLAGISPTYQFMLACLVVMGVVGGGYHPASPPLIAAVVEPRHLGRAMGLHMVGGSAPFFLTPLIAVALAALWGWRGAFIALAVPTLLLGIVIHILLTRRTRGAAAAPAPAAAPPRPEESPPRRFRGQIAPFIVLSTFTHAFTYCVLAFVPLYLVDRYGLGKEAAAAFLSIYFSAGLWASLLGGMIADRLGSVPVVLTVCFITAPAIYLLTLMPGPLGIGALLFVMGVCNYIRTPVSETFLVSQTDERHRSTVLGAYYFSNYEGGGVLAPLMGFLIDRFGFQFGFSLIAALALAVVLICWLWMRGVAGRDRGRR
jgi:predicted MFS family arabinose efflux permease